MVYDVIIIGGGVAGYSAAIYAARFNLKTLVLAERLGGSLQDTHVVENYPGYRSISGYDLMKKFEEHVKDYKVEISEEEVVDVKKKKENFYIRTKKATYVTKTIIFATGIERRTANIRGEKRFKNKGVSYCAACDAPLFKGKIVAVVGGSDSAAKEALLLANYAKNVYIIYRKERIRAEPINLGRIKRKKKIKVINNTNVVEIGGDDYVTYITLDKPYNGNKKLKLDGLFIEMGGRPSNELAKKLDLKLNKKGEIIIDSYSKTNIEGVYAAGDVTNKRFKQAITAAAEGVNAAFSAYNYIKSKKK